MRDITRDNFPYRVSSRRRSAFQPAVICQEQPACFGLTVSGSWQFLPVWIAVHAQRRYASAFAILSDKSVRTGHLLNLVASISLGGCGHGQALVSGPATHHSQSAGESHVIFSAIFVQGIPDRALIVRETAKGLRTKHFPRATAAAPLYSCALAGPVANETARQPRVNKKILPEANTLVSGILLTCRSILIPQLIPSIRYAGLRAVP